MPAATDTGVALKDRCQFGMYVAPHTVSPTSVNPEFHAAEGQLGVAVPQAGVFCSFDTTWDNGVTTGTSGLSHQFEWNDFATNGVTTPRTLNIAWQPAKTSGTVSLTQIAAGAFDAHINQMAAGMAAYPGQVIVRFGHEMNGNWYKWSVGYAGANKGVTSVADYIAAWQYIHGKLKAADATIKLMWCPNGQDVGGTAAEAYYPGDAYVDILGLDSYNNYGTDHAASWTSPFETYQPMYDRLDAIHATKPIWVGETGCMGGVTNQSKSQWIADLFAETRLPRLVGLTYFNAVGGQDWRFSTSTSAASAASVGYRSVAGAVLYTPPPAPAFTIPANTHSMYQAPGDPFPRILLDRDGKMQLGSGLVAVDTKVYQRAGVNLLAQSPTKFSNATSAPAQQGDGPVVYGSSGSLKVVPSAGPSYTLKRALLDVYGLKALSENPAICTSTGTPTAGVIYFARVRVDDAGTFSGVALYVNTAGSGLTTGCLAGLYDTSGVRLAQTADQASNWTTTGPKSPTFTSAYTGGTPGSYLIAVVANGTTPPAIARTGIAGASGFVHNFNLVGVNCRWSSWTTTGQTTLPATIDPAQITGTVSLPLCLGLT